MGRGNRKFYIFTSISVFSRTSLHATNAHSNMTAIPVADYNTLHSALPLNCIISPCQADDLGSRDVDVPVVTTITQYNGSFVSHHSPSTEMKWLPHAVKFIFVSRVLKKAGILCAMLAELWTGRSLELNIYHVFDSSCCSRAPGWLPLYK